MSTDLDVPRPELYGMTEREYEVADGDEMLARMPPEARQLHELSMSTRCLVEFLERVAGLLSPSGGRQARTATFAAEMDRLAAAFERFWGSEAYAEFDARLEAAK